MNDERGVIRNRDAALQIRNFSGLRYGNITPTDIDGMIEYHNRGYVLIETKYGDSELPQGQRLALERITDDLRKPSVAIVASHESTGDIDVANAIVRELRYQRKWHTTATQYTVRQIVDRFVVMLDGGE